MSFMLLALRKSDHACNGYCSRDSQNRQCSFHIILLRPFDSYLQKELNQNFVVLPAGPLRPHRMDVDFRIRDRHVWRDLQHRDLGSTPPPAARRLELHEAFLERIAWCSA